MLKRTLKPISLVTLLLLIAGIAPALWATDKSSLPVLTASEKQALVSEFRKVRSDLTVEDVLRTPVQGLYEVRLVQGLVLYIFEGGKQFIAGDLYSLEGDGIVNVTDIGRMEKRKQAIDSVSADDMIIFPATTEKAVVTVFTDVDCYYCQKLHLEMPAYNEHGITIRYMAYPRAGIGSDSYKRIASAWCAQDRNETLTRLKRGEQIQIQSCANNPVARHFMVGDRIGVRGTPAIVLPNGDLITGHVSAKALAQALALKP